MKSARSCLIRRLELGEQSGWIVLRHAISLFTHIRMNPTDALPEAIFLSIAVRIIQTFYLRILGYLSEAYCCFPRMKKLASFYVSRARTIRTHRGGQILKDLRTKPIWKKQYVGPNARISQTYSISIAWEKDSYLPEKSCEMIKP